MGKCCHVTRDGRGEIHTFGSESHGLAWVQCLKRHRSVSELVDTRREKEYRKKWRGEESEEVKGEERRSRRRRADRKNVEES